MQQVTLATVKACSAVRLHPVPAPALLLSVAGYGSALQLHQHPLLPCGPKPTQLGSCLLHWSLPSFQNSHTEAPGTLQILDFSMEWFQNGRGLRESHLVSSISLPGRHMPLGLFLKAG